MATTKSLPLQQRVPLSNTLHRLSDLVVLFLLVSLLCYRLASRHRYSLLWLVALLCEAWFTVTWALYTCTKWTPVIYRTFPENLLKQFDELPAVDMFVTTADPKLEPPIITVNTVLSLLAVEYPVEKLACYVSDDGGSPVTFYALVEAAKFAKLWVPFCKRYKIPVRAPSVYFSNVNKLSNDLASDFREEWKLLKEEYEKLRKKIDDAWEDKVSFQANDGFDDFSNIERGNHPSRVKVIWENKEGGRGGFPHVVYVSREKRPKHPHHFKAGAMNVLARVSGVMTNAPFMLNVDCDMFANNPNVVLHAMCLLLGFEREIFSGYVQTMQQFHGGLPDDPFGNQLVVLQHKVGIGMVGIQGPVYGGTGCFHRRKIMYGSPPDIGGEDRRKYDVLSEKEPETVFGTSRELLESAGHILLGSTTERWSGSIGLSARIEVAKQVASCTYEFDTCWGQEIGWAYGSMTEDVLTGLRIQSMGWRSVYLTPDPPAFLGLAPTGGPASLTQFKRWSAGLLEILLGPSSPVLGTLHRNLSFRQCLAYLHVTTWALRSVIELCYSLLPAYSFLSNTSFWPKASEPAFVLPVSILIFWNFRILMDYKECGLSVRAWWNNQRMQRIYALTAWFFGFLSVLLKLLGLSETMFEVTRKDQHSDDGEPDPGRFSFDSSPLFVPGTAVVLANMTGLAVGLLRMVRESEAVRPGLEELLCSVWILLSLWPFVRGLFAKGSYRIPWPTILKAAALVTIFSQISTSNSEN